MPPKTRRTTFMSPPASPVRAHTPYVTTYTLPTMPVEVLPNILVGELSEDLSSLTGIPNYEDANMANYNADDAKPLRTLQKTYSSPASKTLKNIGSN